MSRELETYCLDLYRRTRELWLSLEGKYPTWACRFSILYGPPRLKPHLFIVGINPGYSIDTLYNDEIMRWPVLNEYTSADWRLATRLRETFERIGRFGDLQECVGSNTIFFKSSGLIRGGDRTNKHFWSDNPLNIRRELERYSLNELRGLLDVIKPRQILTLGLEAFNRLDPSDVKLVVNSRGRRIAATGEAQGCHVIGTLHPTGAQISTADRATIEDCIASNLM